ncbi:MAG: amino acid ABC transporter substrate-binding protein [Patescibacteria group bacterium]|nr:amino acid ABC transporter substrate-binding protein [Patescibacteria group bacterium]
MKKFAKDIVTLSNGEDYDMGRVLIIVGSLAFLMFEAIAVINSKTFDMQAFGIGYGAVLLSGGGHLWLKRTTEPDGEATTEQEVNKT